MSRYLTRQRKALLTYFRSHADEPLSAYEIADALREQDVSQSAVYRNIAELEAEGQLRRSYKENAREVFYQYVAAESCRGCLHLHCTRCGKTIHVGPEVTRHIVEAVEALEDFSVDRPHSVLNGVCRECRDK